MRWNNRIKNIVEEIEFMDDVRDQVTRTQYLLRKRMSNGQQLLRVACIPLCPHTNHHHQNVFCSQRTKQWSLRLLNP